MTVSSGPEAQAIAHPWLERYPPDVEWARPLPMRPLHEIMDAAVAAHDARPCLDFLGRRYSYAEVGALIDRAAKGFQQLGVEKGARVGLCLPNSPYYVICYFAVLKAGGVVVNYNPLYTERELAHQVEDSGTEIMVTLDLRQLYAKAAALRGSTGLKRLVVCPMAQILPSFKGLLFSLLKRGEIARVPEDDQTISFARLTDNDGRCRPPAIEPFADIAVLQYTGGTTGTPKGAMLTHANLVANTEQVTSWFPKVEPGRERMLAVIPFFHVFAMTVVMNLGLRMGAELVLLPRFEIRQLLKTIVRKAPTLFPGVPTLYRAIATHPGIGRYDLSSIKFCISGGAPLPLEVKADFERLTGCVLVEGYGLTEASPVATCNPLFGVNKAGSIGVPLPGTVVEVRSLADPREKAPAGEKGEICIRGPQVMSGYWRRPEETADVMVDGFLRTGDVGRMDEDGYIFLVDRIKDVVICSGFKVYPRIVEEAVYLHPAVAACTVIGIPDDYRGQAPKAFVQLRDGMALSEAELLAFLEDKLSHIEMPKAVEFRAELPKTTVGKLSKKELVAEEMARLAARNGQGAGNAP